MWPGEGRGAGGPSGAERWVGEGCPGDNANGGHRTARGKNTERRFPSACGKPSPLGKSRMLAGVAGRGFFVVDGERGSCRMDTETGGWATGAGGQKVVGIWIARTALGLRRARGRGRHPSPNSTFQTRLSPAPLSKEGLDQTLGPERRRARTCSLQDCPEACRRQGRAGHLPG